MSVWSNGQLYESYIGRWSRPIARSFIDWLAIGGDKRWIDVGCGTGALTQAILAAAAPASVVAIDTSADYVFAARGATDDARVSFELADATHLPCADSSCDAAVSGLVINFVAEPRNMVVDMARVVRPSGTVAAYVWDYAGKMELIRRFWEAASALDENAAPLHEGRRFPICHPDALTDLWRASGLEEVDARPIDIVTRFRDFDDYWQPFLSGQGPAPGYVMSLDATRREALRDLLRSMLPHADDGSIELVARAWAVRGVKPSASIR